MYMTLYMYTCTMSCNQCFPWGLDPCQRVSAFLEGTSRLYKATIALISAPNRIMEFCEGSTIAQLRHKHSLSFVKSISRLYKARIELSSVLNRTMEICKHISDFNNKIIAVISAPNLIVKFTKGTSRLYKAIIAMSSARRRQDIIDFNIPLNWPAAGGKIWRFETSK